MEKIPCSELYLIPECRLVPCLKNIPWTPSTQYGEDSLHMEKIPCSELYLIPECRLVPCLKNIPWTLSTQYGEDSLQLVIPDSRVSASSLPEEYTLDALDTVWRRFLASRSEQLRAALSGSTGIQAAVSVIRVAQSSGVPHCLAQLGSKQQFQ
ncbi:hypothetical protein J6590_016151 [Homalodisca vitripennis]|nr:hypothetical protein J6590_016151 [Homalodisca vitripennis]